MNKLITPVSENFHRPDYEAVGLRFGETKSVTDLDLIQDERLRKLVKFGIVRVINVLSGEEPTARKRRKDKSTIN